MNLVASDFNVTREDPEYLTGANLGHVVASRRIAASRVRTLSSKGCAAGIHGALPPK